MATGVPPGQLVSAAMNTVFHRIGPYEIDQEIGRGGMAVVFLATDTRTSSRVALRLVATGRDQEADGTLEAECWGAKLQEQFCLASPHVPRVYEHGIQDGYLYIAMEYLDGQNLSEVIVGGPLPASRAIGIGMQLCDFLEAAHAFEVTIDGRPLRSLLHGDLQPRNIRILQGDQVKVLDFGIAKALSLSRKVTRNDFGSIAYLSPERLDTGDIDAHADLWAVGVLLYEMVSGTRPFRAADTRRLEQQILARRAPIPLDHDCPVGLQAVVARALAADPADRYASAKAMRDDLSCAASGTETEAQRAHWPARAVDEPSTRRTRRPDVVDEVVTKRTAPDHADETIAAPSILAPPILAPPILTPVRGDVVPERSPKRPMKRFPTRFLQVALLATVLLIIANEMSVSRTARRLAAMAPTQELDDTIATWRAYDGLRSRSMRGGFVGLERALAQQTEVLAERVFSNYRTPQPTVREAQWKSARELIAEALAAKPGDSRLKAALRYCDGHLHRIRGEARLSKKLTAEAKQEFAEAVTAFREAAELRSDWPDPFLGLMRTFIYGLEDVDRGADALKQAQRLGYQQSDREMAQLGDGYRARADTFARTARTLLGLPQEQDYLSRAAESYRRALECYSNAVGFGDVPRNIRSAQRGLTQIEERLEELSSKTVGM
jgi:eukaryotic-like serine/threonine-protein kinase